MNAYPKAEKYPDLEVVYSQCSGPGGLRLAEFIADKLDLRPGMRLLDIGIYRGYQTCFLAKEYGIFVVAADPWNDTHDPHGDGKPFVDHLRRNAQEWGVADRILGVQVGVPDLKFANESFDAAYSTTALEMIRGHEGEERYRECLSDVLRVLRPGTLFGLGEPMHLDVPMPEDLAPLIDEDLVNCIVTLEETLDAFTSVGFEIVESGYAPDAREWWDEFARNDPGCKAKPDGEKLAIEANAGRWVSFGYVVAKKPG